MKTIADWVKLAKRLNYPIVGRFHTADKKTFTITWMSHQIVVTKKTATGGILTINYKKLRGIFIPLDNEYDGVFYMNIR